ncbi:DUF3857 domain-containing protein [Mucilaginibacter flavidus]|uniref:DUF3857 domain-containing protein n=1 Tax=Mucilaginibacter flavidus TaxID=2949309 RepID=UPI002093401C|nr:DUF3857 domain-containing protein [Mucilaginibacter flavidus]MCO5950599.1 DUF3857 domain-containing protein [Mucilaginibacter flavidus]
MKRLFTLLLLLCAVMVSKGQTQPYGQIDIADLKLTACDFEKDANALVLFDKTEVYTQDEQTIILKHRRVKILNEKGLGNANVTIAWYSKSNFEKISDLDAQTINLENGQLIFTPVDKALIYKQAASKLVKTLTINFPNVKTGSVIEYSFRTKVDYNGALPTWDFQETLPVRYSEFNTYIQRGFSFRIFPNVNSPFEKKIKEAIRNKSNDSVGVHFAWAVKNTPSYKDEPYATCREDNIQCVRFYKTKSPYNFSSFKPTWGILAGAQMSNEKIKEQLEVDLKDDLGILPGTASLVTDDEKIAYVFNKIKTGVRWNNVYDWGTADGVEKAWGKKQGSSGEISYMLYNFLRLAGIKSCITYAATRSHGRLYPDLPGMYGFNTMVVTVNLTPKLSYLLDASNRFNSYTTIPFYLLNGYSLVLDPDSKVTTLKTLTDSLPIRKSISVMAQVNADGKLVGSAHILTTGNARINKLQQYYELGDEKYKTELRNNDNNLQILSLKRENADVDSLPLLENIDFKLDLTSSDEKYLYINPTLFTSLNNNPFLSETRQAAIDYGNLSNLSARAVYTAPAGYKVESLPQNVSMITPDKGISFKRIVSNEDGKIATYYNISLKRTQFSADEYPGIRDFYKKMFEMLNEQIVLKKN